MQQRGKSCDEEFLQSVRNLHEYCKSQFHQCFQKPHTVRRCLQRQALWNLLRSMKFPLFSWSPPLYVAECSNVCLYLYRQPPPLQSLSSNCYSIAVSCYFLGCAPWDVGLV